jgi:hypothetical protein
MSPYLYRRLRREKLAQLREGRGRAPHVRHVYVSRPDLGRCRCFRLSTRMWASSSSSNHPIPAHR